MRGLRFQHPAELIGDLGDSVFDVVTIPAELIRTAKWGVRGVKDQAVTGLKGQASMPNPVTAGGNLISSLISVPVGVVNNIGFRIKKLVP